MNRLLLAVGGIGTALAATWLILSTGMVKDDPRTALSDRTASAVAHLNREAAQTGQELALVRAQMMRLEQQLASLRASGAQPTASVPAPAEPESADEPAHEVSAEAERVRAERRKLAFRQNMSESFAEQPKDAGRNSKFREDVVAALAEDPSNSRSLEAVDCRSLTCRISVVAANPEVDDRPAADLLRGDAFGAIYYHPGERPGETILYIFRPDSKNEVRQLLSEVQQRADEEVGY